MPEWEHTVVSLLSAATYTVFGGPSILKGFFVNTVMSAHQAEIRNNTVSVFKTKASLAEGSYVDLQETKFGTKMVVVCAAAQTGNITVLYRPMRHE